MPMATLDKTCRTLIAKDVNGLGYLKDGRGNCCPVTIILPEIAMLAKERKDEKIIDSFFEILEQKIIEAKDCLLERYHYICSQDPASAKFMYENGLAAGYNPDEGIESAMKHFSLAIGQLGLAECLQILIGVDHVDPKGMELAKQIEQLFSDKCNEFKKEYSLNFGVYYSPEKIGSYISNYISKTSLNGQA